MQPYTLFWCTMMESKTMRVAQRVLLRITSTFQAMKLLDNGQKGEHKNKHSRWQLGMNNRSR